MVPPGFYLAATLILTFPVMTRLETHAAGAPYGDAFEAVRLIWWTKEALLRGMHPAYQPLLVYPTGFFSPVEWASPMAHLAGLPFALLFPPLAAYNLTFLASWVLTGLAAYLFCRELTRGQGPALLGGLVLMAFPTRLGHATAGHLTLITNYWLLLYAWSLVRLWRGAGWRWGLLSGLFLVLTAGTYPTNLAYELIPLTVAFGGAVAWQRRREWRWWLPALAALLAVAAGGLLLLYAPLMEGYLSGRIANLQESGVVRYSTDLLGFITPSPFNPVLGQLGLVPGWAWDVLGDNTIEAAAYLGLVAVALAGLACWKRRAEAWPWLLTALVGMTLSLGPVLKVADRVVEVPIEDDLTSSVLLPYGLYSAVPGLGLGRTPGRLNMVTAVALAALAAHGLAELRALLPGAGRRAGRALRRWLGLSRPLPGWIGAVWSPLWPGGLVAGLAALVMVEYQLFAPFPMTEAPMPGYLATLAEQAARGEVRPVLNLPAGDFFVTRWLLYYQTEHRQPVLAGHVVRSTPANPAMLALVNAAALPPEEGGLVPAMTPAQQGAVLRAAGAEVVVVHRAFGDGEQMAAHLGRVLGPPVYEDPRVAVFEVPPGPLPDEVVYAAAGGWEADAASARWLDEALTLSFYVPEARAGFWQFGASPWLLERWLRLDLGAPEADAYHLTDEGDGLLWRSSAVSLPVGFHQARFWLPPEVEDCLRLPGEPGCRRALLRRPLFVFQDENQTPFVEFGDKMRLMSVSVRQVSAGRCTLRFYWQALGSEREDYTLFVHMLDAEGELVAQWDGPLGGQETPTSQWPPHGFAFQEVTLRYPAEALPPGTYQLYAGLYTYPDLTRLPVNSDRPRAEDRLLYLQDIAIPSSTAVDGR